ncbi:hypothetical protein KB553_09775 [Chryseobacterium rhizoplanae]|uniref:helix-turn-helix transcriptional regulator n=1 Tax=Chryseobacterium rhizoplanae TaxID=1609531 RepID=UPI001CE2B6A7|nr:hypothetical protein [Chryseobacterium rhizoplanae]UCA61795.1 hypothetical protein KB553_09775 [Chryseobacterium rhizoplanae]
MKTLFLMVLLTASSLIYAQSDSDKDLQSVLACLRFNRFSKAETIIDEKFLNSGNESKKIIGYVLLSLHYNTDDKPQKRIELLKKAHEITETTNKFSDRAYVEYGYAKFYLESKEDELFLASINRGFAALEEVKNENFLASMYYNLKARYHINHFTDKGQDLNDIKENSIKAVEYAIKSKNTLLIGLQNDSRSLELFYHMDQKNRLIEQLEAKNKTYAKQMSLYMTIAGVGIAGIIIVMVLFLYRQKRNSFQTDLLTKEKNKITQILEIEKVEKNGLWARQQELTQQRELLQRQVMVTSFQLELKNTILNEIKENIEENDVYLKKILKEDRKSEDDFNELQAITQDIHPLFYDRMQKLSKTKLTHQDLKYAAYIYLNMDNLQISNTLKVAPATVRVNKYRLKQKLGLGKEDDLCSFIHSLCL